MRKSFSTYVILWAIGLVVFNAIIFLIPSTLDGLTISKIVMIAAAIKGGSVNTLDAGLLSYASYLEGNDLILDKYGGAFWPCYVCIMLAFVGQLICASIAFKETNSQKFFYNIPLIRISYTGLILTIVFGVIGMFIPDCPIWIPVVVCAIVFVLVLVALLKAKLTASIISDKDEEINEATSFIKEMTAKAKAIYDTDKTNDDYKKLFEAFRYANKMSSEKTKQIEESIIEKMCQLSGNIDADKVAEIVALIKERETLIK